MSMFAAIEDAFAAGARTRKGGQAMRAIFKATSTAVADLGVHATSLDVIADRAGLSQAALRHYFATRDDLLDRYFVTATEWYQAQVASLFEARDVDPRMRIERCIDWHLEYMESVDTVAWLEASAFWLRNARNRRVRDNWYSWLIEQYAALLADIHPLLSVADRRRRAFAMVTLILGAWITHGRGSALKGSMGPLQRRQFLIDATMDLAGV